MRTYYYRWEWLLKSTPEDLWPLVADTHTFNQLAGLPPIVYEFQPGPDGITRTFVTMKIYGQTIKCEESPFEWVRPQHFGVNRRYLTGPLATMRTLATLTTVGTGTRLVYETWAVPRNILGQIAAPVQIGLLSQREFERAFRRIDDYARLQKQAVKPVYIQPPQHPLSAASITRLDGMLSRLVAMGEDPALVERLGEHIRLAPDEELSRMRPYAFAERWEMDRYEVLKLFLRSASIGLLDLSWDLLCPDCRGATEKNHTLRDLHSSGHCPVCNIDFSVDFERSVEATFQLNAAIKHVERVDFCTGGPQNSPHILAQQNIPAGATRSFYLNLASGRYRLRAPRTRTSTTNRTPAASPENIVEPGEVIVNATAFDAQRKVHLDIYDARIVSDSHPLQTGEVEISLTNHSQREHLIIVELAQWISHAATAAEITTMQTFRDLFSSEALRPGETVRIESLVFLFTDLKGSTMLYRDIGDASAFGQVMNHFDLLKTTVDHHHGSIVKTIGDAIMAVFRDPAEAVQACLEIIRSMDAYNAQSAPHKPLRIKLGLHQGPCIAVTLNDRLDYFGSTVNTAARLEGQSNGQEVVISHHVMLDPGVEHLLAGEQVETDTFTAMLKGLEGDYTLFRVRPRITDTVSRAIGAVI